MPPRRYTIQKHAARRLHYDLRLELDGALKSWALPRGPSLVAGERRLAVQVEDHALDYAEYEGVIGPGSYGAGAVLVWDRGTWEPTGEAAADPAAAYAAGTLAFRLHGVKLAGGWRLVRLRPRQERVERQASWLLGKSRDAAARERGEPDILDEQPRSVLTGRSIEEVGSG